MFLYNDSLFISVMLIPSIMIFPEFALKKPLRRFAIVVLPLPDDPTKAILSPLFIVKLNLSIILDLP